MNKTDKEDKAKNDKSSTREDRLSFVESVLDYMYMFWRWFIH